VYHAFGAETFLERVVRVSEPWLEFFSKRCTACKSGGETVFPGYNRSRSFYPTSSQKGERRLKGINEDFDRSQKGSVGANLVVDP